MGTLTTSWNAGERGIGVAAVALMLVAVPVAIARTVEDPARLSIEQPDELTIEQPDEPTDEPTIAPDHPTEPTGRTQPSATPSTTPSGEGQLVFHDPSETDNSAPPPAATTASTGTTTSWFGSRYPSHEAATESVREPATTRWAVLIGINEHTGRTRDNLGSRQDAEDLAAHLASLGWRSDHVLLLTDATATRRHILEGLAWLARKTSDDSVVVIHYSGHVKQWYGQDVDGDGEVTDEALWPSDNQFILDSELSKRVARVRAERLWVDIGGCEAAGFADPPMVRSNAVYTFSSAEDEKSYEDPSKFNSVWGWYLVDRGLMQGHGDRNNDGIVTVEEAFAYAAPHATARTEHQERGPQTPEIIDNLSGDFSLDIPPPPDDPSPTQDPTSPPPDDGCLLGIIC